MKKVAGSEQSHLKREAMMSETGSAAGLGPLKSSEALISVPGADMELWV